MLMSMWEAEYTDEFGSWYEALNEEDQDAVLAPSSCSKSSARGSDGPLSTTCIKAHRDPAHRR